VRRLLIATTNPHKMREIRGLLSDAPIELVGLDDLLPLPEPDETGETFHANARLKARYYAAAHRMLTAAEDSGLVVDALDGEPGVRSARFLRPEASYPERFAEIYRRLAERPPAARSARFVCALAVVFDGEVIFETTGTVEGEISSEPRGGAGFGYDPIFYYPPYGRTFAEVSDEEKLRVAHRGVAFRRLSDWLRTGETSEARPEF
jgi:XTP/dITP diphosphohydrolase